MEKSGALNLDLEDIVEYGKGKVSQRIQQDWGLTHRELHGMIKSNQIRLVPKQKQTEDHIDGKPNS